MRKLMCIVLIFCTLVLVGCGSNTNDYKLIELSFNEFIDLYDSGEKMLVACINETTADVDLIMEKLSNYSKESFNQVYYVNITDMNVLQMDYYVTLLDNDLYDSYLYEVNNRKIVSSNKIPDDIDNLNRIFSNNSFKELDITSLLEARKDNYLEGINALADGYISTAKSNFLMSIPYEEALNILEDESILNIVNTWEYFNKSKNNCNYVSLDMNYNGDIVYVSKYNGKCSGFNKENIKPVRYNYKYDGENILYSDIDSDEYKVLYTIKDVSKNTLVVKDIKDKELVFNSIE